MNHEAYALTELPLPQLLTSELSGAFENTSQAPWCPRAYGSQSLPYDFRLHRVTCVTKGVCVHRDFWITSHFQHLLYLQVNGDLWATLY
jgi:hypothetical protein